MVVHDDLRFARVTPRLLEISYSMGREAFLENLALAPGRLPKFERGHARRTVEGANEIGEIVEPDIIGDIGHGFVILGQAARRVSQPRA
jgi:hypothetical protein